MKVLSVVVIVTALLCLGWSAQADVFNLGPGLTNLDTVPVGDRGNAGELCGEGAGSFGPDRVCGAVDYSYRIGKYEVTAAQYTDFLNHVAADDVYGLYNAYMWTAEKGCKIERLGTPGSYSYRVASDWANRPVNYVSFWDACRFANWVHNGQGYGGTETGAYTLDTYNGADGRNIGRNAGWRWAVASEDEWYKAAYYKGHGTNSRYWDYPTRSDSVPGNLVLATDPGNSANYYDYVNYSVGSPYYRTNVGEFENSASEYGTFDQGGNVWEWNDTLTYDWLYYRGVHGGDFGPDSSKLRSLYRSGGIPNVDDFRGGFRLVAVAPEPSSLIVLACGLPALIALRRRKIG